MRTVHLRERQPRELHLSASAVRTLIDLPSKPIELSPLGGRRFRATPRGVAGVLLVAGVRFHIRPKLPLGNLLRMIDPDAPLPPESDRIRTSPDGEILPILLRRLLDLLATRLRSGLRREYVESRQTDGFARGRIDIGRQMRKVDRRPDRFETHTSEWTLDHASNRLPRSTIEFLLAHPLVDATTRQALSASLSHFEGVTSIPLDLRDFDGPSTELSHLEERPLLDLCRWLAGMLSMGGGSGRDRAPAFLLEMDRLFEGWVSRGLRAALPTREVATQKSLAVFEGSDIDPSMRPDLMVYRRGDLVRVLDVKWKSLANGTPNPADLHQILSYALRTGCSRVGLIYPGTKNALRRRTIAGTGVELSVIRLKVTGDAEAARRALAWLGRRVR